VFSENSNQHSRELEVATSPLHRALIRFTLNGRQLVEMLGIALMCTAVWFLALPAIGQLWSSLFEFWLSAMNLDGAVGAKEIALPLSATVTLPQIRLSATAPSESIWYAVASLCAATFASTFRLPDRWLPVSYLLRALVIIQVSALIYFRLTPLDFPYTLTSYLDGMLASGLLLIGIVPLLLLLTYYLFDYSILQKLGLTFLAMTYLVIFVPLQYLVHAAIIHTGSLLFMPLLFFAFGIPPQILILIALYSWAMTWQQKA